MGLPRMKSIVLAHRTFRIWQRRSIDHDRI